MNPQLQEQSNLTSAQWNKLRRLLTYASTKVPYYRSMFDRLKVNPHDIDSLEKFSQLPSQKKQTIQQQWNDFISEDYEIKDLVLNNTSGSTGIPMKVAQTRAELTIAGRHFMRERMRWGVSQPTRWAMVGDVLDFVNGNTDLVRRKPRGGGEELMLHWDLKPSTIYQYLRELEAFQPVWIYSYPPMMERMAQFMLSNGISIELRDIRLIELAGEYLSPQVREDVTRAFGYKPASEYACRELWGIAFECPEGGMHVMTDHVLLEIVKDNGTPAAPGETGEAIVTGLNNWSMPFIRYRLGDVLMPLDEKCSCGDPRPLIRVMGGRVANFMFGRHNRLGDLTFNLIVRHLYDNGYQGIQEYRVVQRSEILFEVWIVRTPAWAPVIQKLFTEKVQSMLGSDIQLDFKFVDTIPLSPAGKSKPFVVDLL